MSDVDPHDLNDEELEVVLRDALRPVTETHRSAAVAAYEWRYLDAELATLVAEPGHDQQVVLRDDRASGVQELTFSAGAETITVEVEPADAHTVNAVLTVGSAIPYDGCFVRLADGSGRALTLDDGSTVITGLAATSPFRIELQRGGKVAVVSEWISL